MTARKPTAQELMFEAVCDVFGWDPVLLPRGAKARIGKVASELREVGGTPEMVRFSRQVLDRHFARDTTYGPEAIALWWGEVAKQWRWHAEAQRRREREAAEKAAYEPATPEELAENRRRWRQMMVDLKIGTVEELIDGLPE